MDKINQILVKYCRYTKTRITRSLEFELYHVLVQCNNKVTTNLFNTVLILNNISYSFPTIPIPRKIKKGQLSN